MKLYHSSADGGKLPKASLCSLLKITDVLYIILSVLYLPGS